VTAMRLTPRVAAQYVFVFLDLRRVGVGDAEAIHDALGPLRGPGRERLAEALGDSKVSDVADNFDRLAVESGASSLASLALILRSERPGPAMASALQRQAELDAVAPSLECCTAARFVIAFCDARAAGKTVHFALLAALEFIGGPGQEELAVAVRAERFSDAAVAGQLEQVAASWGSPVLADLAASLRQDSRGGSAALQSFLVRSATSEAEAGVGTVRAALAPSRPAGSPEAS